jgi:hypothetical protein
MWISMNSNEGTQTFVTSYATHYVLCVFLCGSELGVPNQRAAGATFW